MKTKSTKTAPTKTIPAASSSPAATVKLNAAGRSVFAGYTKPLLDITMTVLDTAPNGVLRVRCPEVRGPFQIPETLVVPV